MKLIEVKAGGKVIHREEVSHVSDLRIFNLKAWARSKDKKNYSVVVRHIPSPPKRKLTDEQIEKAARLRQEGKSYRELGRIFHVDEKTIPYWIKKAKTD